MDKRMVYVIINLFLIVGICELISNTYVAVFSAFIPCCLAIGYIMQMCKGRNKQSIYVLLDKLYSKKKSK